MGGRADLRMGLQNGAPAGAVRLFVDEPQPVVGVLGGPLHRSHHMSTTSVFSRVRCSPATLCSAACSPLAACPAREREAHRRLLLLLPQTTRQSRPAETAETACGCPGRGRCWMRRLAALAGVTLRLQEASSRCERRPWWAGPRPRPRNSSSSSDETCDPMRCDSILRLFPLVSDTLE